MEIIEYVNARKVLIRFISTGYQKFVQASTIRTGEIKDPYYPSVHGVGHLGEGLHKVSVGRKLTKAYTTWTSMLRRCYDPLSLESLPTYIGCSVVDAWLCFQTFAEWFDEHYVVGQELDKDIKVPGNRIYGPDTCMFVTPAENLVAAGAVTVIFRSPNGLRVEVYNISKFARENGLDQGALSRVKNGKAGHHKGWALWKEEEKQSGG